MNEYAASSPSLLAPSSGSGSGSSGSQGGDSPDQQSWFGHDFDSFAFQQIGNQSASQLMGTSTPHQPSVSPPTPLPYPLDPSLYPPPPPPPAQPPPKPKDDSKKLEKRARNTEAARKYRQKRTDRIAELEDALQRMTSERDDLKLELAKKDAEVSVLRDMVSRR